MLTNSTSSDSNPNASAMRRPKSALETHSRPDTCRTPLTSSRISLSSSRARSLARIGVMKTSEKPGTR